MRSFFKDRGISYKRMNHKDLKPIAAGRVKVDYANRRIFERAAAIALFDKKLKTVAKRTKDETEWCNAEVQGYETLSATMNAEVKRLLGENEVLRAKLGTLDPKGSEYKAFSVELKVILAKITHLDYLLEDVSAAMRYTMVHLRQTTRRAVGSNTQSGEVAKHLNWIDEETGILKHLMKFVKSRDDKLSDSIENKYYKEWLKDQYSRIVARLVAYDTEQESIIESNLARLTYELSNGVNDRHSVIEILGVLRSDRKFDSERIGCETARLRSEVDSDDSLKYLARQTALKAKQQQLRENVMPTLTKALTGVHNSEDKVMDVSVAFKGDQEGMSRHQMRSIQAVLRSPPKARKTFSLGKWMDLFRSQPWLSRQNAEEARLSDIRKSARKELEKQHTVLQKQRVELDKDKEIVAVKEKKILDLLAKAEAPDDPKAKVQLTELERKDMRTEAQNLRDGIDAETDDKKRREDSLVKAEVKLADEFKVIDADEADANYRLSKQKDAIEAFKAEEFEGDKVIMKEIEDCRAEIERERALLYKMAAIENETRVASGGAVSDEKEVERIRLALEAFEKKAEAMNAKEAEVKAGLERREQFYKQAEKEAEDELRNKALKELQEELRNRKVDVIKAQNDLKAEIERDRKAGEVALEAERRRNWQALKADEEIASLGVAGMSASGTRKTGVSTKIKQWLRKKAGTRDDPEQVQMQATIKKRMKIKGGQIEAIRFIKFTVGKVETDEFTAKNSKLQGQGMPFFRRISREIGLHDQIVVWAEKTIDQDEFLTSLELSHTDPAHENYVNLNDDGWEKSGHQLMMGADLKQPSFSVWFHKDGKSLAIVDIDISYSMADEGELQGEGYEMLEPNLSVFGFGDMHVWTRKAERAMVPTVANSAHVAKELYECRKMLSKKPDDAKLKQMEEKLVRKLAAAQLHEDESRENDDNPIRYTMEFMALNPLELEKFLTYYSKIDKDKDGFITMEEFCEFINEPMSDFIIHIFKLTDALDEHDRLDFGETIKALSTFSMLWGEEILRLLYAMYDSNGQGFINRAQFLEKLSILHPHFRGRTTRAMKEFDLPRQDKITFNNLVAYDRLYPNMFHPAFRIQNSVRVAFFGVSWWERKLRLYMTMKDSLKKTQMTSQMTDQKDELRKGRKVQKRARAKQRIELARESKSMFVRSLFIAKNVADALIPDIDVDGKSFNPFTRVEEQERERIKLLQEQIERES